MSDRQIIPADQILPNKLFIVPLDGKPIFPGIFTPVMIQSEEDIDVIDRAMSTDSMIGLLLTKESTDNPKINSESNEFHQVGTVAKIVKKINLPDGGYNIFISTLKRFKVKKFPQRNTR